MCKKRLFGFLTMLLIIPSWVFGVCGDGVIDSGENCDDSNTAGADGCSAACRVEATTVAIWPKNCPLSDDANYSTYSDSTPDSRYVLIDMSTGDATDDIVVDVCTGYMWERFPDDTYYQWQSGTSPSYTFPAAAHCVANNKGGFSDWRLPTRLEAMTIVDYVKINPSWNENFFLGNVSNYWTASPAPLFPDFAWELNYVVGAMVFDLIFSPALVRCVR